MKKSVKNNNDSTPAGDEMTMRPPVFRDRIRNQRVIAVRFICDQPMSAPIINFVTLPYDIQGYGLVGLWTDQEFKQRFNKEQHE
jgi:hypothetical protein